VLFNHFMNNNTFKNMEEQGIQVLYAPLSEYMWFIWRDYLAQANNQKESAAYNELDKFSSYIKTISDILAGSSAFEKNLENLVERADKYLNLYAGGNGRYRWSKILGDLSHVNGIITVASMYENTNTILNILSQNERKLSAIPILNMTYDGNENEIDNSKIDSFIYYAFQENLRKEKSDKRGA